MKLLYPSRELLLQGFQLILYGSHLFEDLSVHALLLNFEVLQPTAGELDFFSLSFLADVLLCQLSIHLNLGNFSLVFLGTAQIDLKLQPLLKTGQTMLIFHRGLALLGDVFSIFNGALERLFVFWLWFVGRFRPGPWNFSSVALLELSS